MNRLHIVQHSRRLAAVVLCLAAWSRNGVGQSAPPVILEVDVENYVQYWNDATDPLLLATAPNQTTTAGRTRTFMPVIHVADVVAVNGKPAKGTYTLGTQAINYRPQPVAGQSVADTNRNGPPAPESLEILAPDGTPVGTIMGLNMVGGVAPPGSPTAQAYSNSTIVGGTGAFLGARGQCGIVSFSANPRNASQTEDPSLRRVYGGGKMKMILYLIPMVRPEITTTGGAPVVVHSSDFTPVTTSQPARPGEILSVFVKGLGPTRPSVDPGTPFPKDPLAVVNAPVEAMLNGAPAEVLAAVGYPGSTDSYQVNFRVPPSTQKGTASLQFSAAWIASSAVSITIQ